MKMATLNEAERALEMNAITIRRRALKGMYPYLLIGTKMMVDLDILRPMVELEKKQKNGINIITLSDKINLTVSSIRRGIKEGWIPHWKEDRRFRFHLADVETAIKARMTNMPDANQHQDGEPVQESKA